jgi:hypothetical protein
MLIRRDSDAGKNGYDHRGKHDFNEGEAGHVD